MVLYTLSKDVVGDDDNIDVEIALLKGKLFFIMSLGRGGTGGRWSELD